MRKILSTALLALLMVAACANPQVSTEAETASITVCVSDASAKTISPEISSATHYRLSLDNAVTGTHAESGFLAKGESFTASDVPAGIWTATADTYIKTGSAGTDDDYTKIATGKSAATEIEGGTNTRISVVIDTLIDAIPGDISITLDVPFSSLEIYGRYSIKGIGQREGYLYQQNDAFVIPWNNPVLTIDTSEISPALYQGTYIIEITASSVEQSLSGTAKAGDVTGNDPVTHGAEAILLLAGQAATGTIKLSDIENPKPEPSHFTYTDNGDGTCTITGENPDNPLSTYIDLTIPDEINGLKVTAIGDSAFGGFGNRVSFSGQLYLGQNIKAIGSYAFYGCGFTGELAIPTSVTTIDMFAFGVNNFAGYLVIPSSVEAIDEFAFTATKFSKIFCEAGARPSGWDSDWNADGIPVTWGYSSIANHFLYTDNANGTCTITGEDPNSPIPSRNGGLTIPDEIDGLKVVEIADRAFTNNSFTGPLTFGENIQIIGTSAFSSNSFTGDLIIPDKVTFIGASAFSFNSFTGDLVIPASVTTIGSSAFDSNSFSAIYCAAESQPSGWSAKWNVGVFSQVTWGYTGGN